MTATMTSMKRGMSGKKGGKSKPPAKPEVLIRPYKGLLLASPSRGTEFFFACILCPTARKRAITITGSLLLVGVLLVMN